MRTFIQKMLFPLMAVQVQHTRKCALSEVEVHLNCFEMEDAPVNSTALDWSGNVLL